MLSDDTEFPNEREDLEGIKEGLDFGDEESDTARLASMRDDEIFDEDTNEEDQGCIFE